MAQAQAFIGTSGWSYADWRRDFYPKGLPSGDWLPHLARHFPTVEVNASFYRLPAPATVRAWGRKAPEGFRFAAKLWRAITHYHRLENVEELVARNVAVLREMPPAKRGPLLVQLPPQLEANLRVMEAFLHLLKGATRRMRWPIAVEFRHPSWHSRASWELLDSFDVAVCVHDMARGAPVLAPNDAPFVYVRRHGPKSRYQGSYTTGQLQEDAARVRAWVEGGRDTYVYFNNDHGGHAHRNARELTALAHQSFHPPPRYSDSHPSACPVPWPLTTATTASSPSTRRPAPWGQAATASSSSASPSWTSTSWSAPAGRSS